MHSWVFRNREELARIYGLARSPRASAKATEPSAADGGARAGRAVPMVRAEPKTPPPRTEPQPAQRSSARLPLARLGRFVLRPLPRSR